MKKTHLITVMAIAILGFTSFGQAWAEVNSGSDGSDGAFNPTTNTVINMADHPNGVYQYTDVNIPSGVTVTFIPNANNTPVYWLVQSNVVINGTVDVSGKSAVNTDGAQGGPGGWAGGGGGGSNPSAGQGPGGGGQGGYAAGGSYATQGGSNGAYGGSIPGAIYGNSYLLPLLGGSGGGGGSGGYYGAAWYGGGGGGGGAILIAASDYIQINGVVAANGGNGLNSGGDGSGGAIRLVATKITGTGSILAIGGFSDVDSGGAGRIRIDTFQNSFSGQVNIPFTQGYQPIIIPTAGQGSQLTVTSVGGVPVSASPSGQITTPDAVLSAQQNNPIPIVVNCSNLPLNTLITVIVKPASGSSVSAVGYNNTGTLASSTATVLLNMPRGGGIIYATAASGN